MAMTARWPFQPLPPLSPNVVGARLIDDLSLQSHDEDDDFDRQMMQDARDARQGNMQVQAFRKARTHPRVGMTLENLERHNAGDNAHFTSESPPSSSGSTRLDPAIQPPSGWGRKGRVKQNWMRTITSDDDDDDGERTPGALRETLPHVNDTEAPRTSVEHSPLMHKTPSYGTPVSVRPQIDDWDLDLNEASLIASTPYLPRNMALEDIRQREMESMREQGVTKHQLDWIGETSPEELPRLLSSSARFTTDQQNGTSEHTPLERGSPDQRTSKRTGSWQKISESQSLGGERLAHSPITVYKKSTETVGGIDRRLLVSAQAGLKRPSHRREDSQDLLRRLARISSTTPSPSMTVTSRAETTPVRQQDGSSQTMVSQRTLSPPSVENPEPTRESTRHQHDEEAVVTATQSNARHLSDDKKPPLFHAAPAPLRESPTEESDAISSAVERSVLNPKTPVVTGAWVDTPRPASVARFGKRPQSPSKSPKKESLARKAVGHQKPLSIDEEPRPPASNFVKPTLPGSVLEAVVEEARANGYQRSTDIGDSTINSLEDLIAPFANDHDEDHPDEDSLQSLQISPSRPRTEAERRRQQELLQLQRMNERLRTARTNIRDVTRGIRRCENKVDHAEDAVMDGAPVGGVYHNCPCAVHAEHQCTNWTIWKGFRSLFYDVNLKPRRRGWGLTLLSIVLIAFLTWLVLENTAWYAPTNIFSQNTVNCSQRNMVPL
jgi:hypothetical protein